MLRQQIASLFLNLNLSRHAIKFNNFSMQHTDLPEWLTKEYMQLQLRTYHKDTQLNVNKLWALTATSKGENYVGVITRIHVEYEDASRSLHQSTYLLKEACPEDAPQAEVFQEYGVFTREMDMYEFVLPKMTQVLREAGIKDKLHADAICIDREHNTLILEDLSLLSYKNACRVQQLDSQHTLIVLEMLAKFHACTLVVKETHPQLLATNYDTSFFSRGVKGYDVVLRCMFKAFIRYVKTQPKLAARYHAKLERTLDNLMEYGARSFDVNENDFQTLIHGDCWTTNIMFQYDAEGNPTSVVPIDFQFSTRTSPAVDLQYFFSTSLQDDVLANETELVQQYYYYLRHFLKQLGFEGKVPSLLDFQLQFERRRFMSLFFSTGFQAAMIYNGTEEPDICKFNRETPEALKCQDAIYDNERIQRKIERALAIFDAKGILDEQ